MTLPGHTPPGGTRIAARIDAALAAASARHQRALLHAAPRPLRGRIRRVVGTMIHASAVETRVGDLCRIADPSGAGALLAEVVALSPDEALLTPLGPITALSSRAEVIATGAALRVRVGPELCGRVLDGLGRPIDGGPVLTSGSWVLVERDPPPPLGRQPIRRALPLGIRALDGLLTCGEGQRIGVFGPAGCGKSTLMADIVRGAGADIAVLALIGERGREVGEFLDNVLGPEGRARAVLVVATSDRPAVERIKAGQVATAVAEAFRDQGLRVLLIMDSVTRFARALREVGLAAGEPPTRRGFPPSVFASLPRLFERTGQGAAGSITAFYTVLVEGDTEGDPIAEEVRGLLDGHVVLSRELAEAAHFPAISVPQSLSRVMGQVVTPAHAAAAAELRRLLARHAEVELLVQVGEYAPGRDPLADRAIARKDAIDAFLRQSEAGGSLEDTCARLMALVA